MSVIPEILRQAFSYHQAGNLQQAERCYRRLLEKNPRHVDALHMLGLLAHQTGRNDMAQEYIGTAVRLKPDFAEAHSNLGNVLQQLGKLDEAISSWRRALRLKPQLAEVHSNLGLALLAQERLDDAEASLRQALKLRKDYPDAHNNLGNVLKRRGRFADAAACYKEALRIKPDYAQAYLNLGAALHEQGQPAEAVTCYEQALRLDPHNVQAPGNLGLALKELGRLDEALVHAQRAVSLAPAEPEARVNLGSLLLQIGNSVEAAACFLQAIRINPKYVEAHYNLGTALGEQGKLNEAFACYCRALELDPDFAEAHWNRSLVRLLRGDFEQGWPEYEWRWRRKSKEFVSHDFAQPLWDGTSLSGRTILLQWEQGFGDTIQFIRYARLLHERGARVVLNCHPALAPLLRHCPGIDEVVPEGAPLPRFDVYAPLLSLPHLFGTTLATIPADVPYLTADPELAARWGPEFSDRSRLRIGIAWQGRPTFRNDRWRSIPLAQFAPLAQLPGVQLFSLQKGSGVEQLAAIGDRFPIVDLASRLDQSGGAFLDTAAVITCLDLVVTSDTAMAHLAGALGAPVWVALNSMPDWRWLMDREDSPWYPTMRLFRQGELGNWEAVFERMAAALRQMSPKVATSSPAGA